jgi:hypothetical protein
MSSNIVWLENPIVNGDFKCNGILNASQFVNNIMGTTYSQEVVEFMAGDIQDALSTQILKILNNIPILPMGKMALNYYLHVPRFLLSTLSITNALAKIFYKIITL